MLGGGFLGQFVHGLLVIFLALLGLLLLTLVISFVVRVCFRAVYSEKRRHLRMLISSADMEADSEHPPKETE